MSDIRAFKIFNVNQYFWVYQILQDFLNWIYVFSEYESAMSDIEETMSILSRRSRSTTPISHSAIPPISAFLQPQQSTKFWPSNAYNPGALDSPYCGSLDRRVRIQQGKWNDRLRHYSTLCFSTA